MHAGSSSGWPDRRDGVYPLRVGVTMSLHKLTVGSGYDYLTRQVAALDGTEKGHIGSGIEGIEGLAAATR